MVRKSSLVAAFVAGSSAISLVDAFPSYANKIPNARNVVVDGLKWKGLGHPNANAGSDQGNPNPFGIDADRVNGNWQSICQLDSDNDGITNGVELCDPDCVETTGGTKACVGGAVLTHPGFAEGDPAASAVGGGAEYPDQFYIHGVLMIFAWIVFAPYGVVRSVFYKKRPGKPAWFRDHKVAMTAAAALTFIAFGVMANFIGTDIISESFSGEYEGESSKHVKYGIFVIVIAAVQPVSGLFRAHLPKPGEAKSLIRKGWEIQHQWTGRLGLILAMCAVASGLPLVFEHGDTTGRLLIAIFVIGGVGCIAYVLLFREKHVAELKAKAGIQPANSMDKKEQNKIAAAGNANNGGNNYNFNQGYNQPAPQNNRNYDQSPPQQRNPQSSWERMRSSFSKLGKGDFSDFKNGANNVRSMIWSKPSAAGPSARYNDNDNNLAVPAYLATTSNNNNNYNNNNGYNDDYNNNNRGYSSDYDNYERKSRKKRKKSSRREVQEYGVQRNSEVEEYNPRYSGRGGNNNRRQPSYWDNKSNNFSKNQSNNFGRNQSSNFNRNDDNGDGSGGKVYVDPRKYHNNNGNDRPRDYASGYGGYWSDNEGGDNNGRQNRQDRSPNDKPAPYSRKYGNGKGSPRGGLGF